MVRRRKMININEKIPTIYNLTIYDNGYSYWMQDVNNILIFFSCLDNELYINGKKYLFLIIKL